jgi:hypothetical protein
LKKIQLLIIFLCSQLFAGWNQSEFFIGAYHQPAFTGNLQTDIKIFSDYRDLGFNVLTDNVLNHVQDPWNERKGYLWFNVAPEAGIQKIDAVYRLSVLTNISGLKTFILQRPIYSRMDSELDEMVNHFKQFTDHYSPQMRDRLIGYTIVPDEADSTNMVDKVLPIIKKIHSNDSEKVSIANFGGSLSGWKNLSSNWEINRKINLENFRKNIHIYLNNSYTNLYSFDYYKFFSYYTPAGVKLGPVTGGSPKQLFYAFLKILAEETHSTNKTFFGVPVCAQHEICEYSRKSTESNWNLEIIRKMPKLTPAIFRHEAYSFIVYGAKGIMWYSYNYPNETEPPLITSWESNKLWGSSEKYSDFPSNNPLIRNTVQEINNELHNMGSVLLLLNWRQTVHGASVDPEIKEPLLDVISNKTPVFYKTLTRAAIEAGSTAGSTWSDDSLAIGIFEKNNSSFLAIMNKSLINTNCSKYNVRGDVYPYIFNKRSGGWSLLERKYNKLLNMTSFETKIIPGDLELVSLSPNQNSPQ